MLKKKITATFIGNLNKTRERLQKKIPRNLKRYIFIGALIILAGSGIYLLARPEPASAEWWNDAWHYRRPITITYSGSSTLNEYQVFVDGLDTATYISAGKLQPDCDDLRFVSENANVLNYFLVGNTCNTSDTEIWVQTDTIPGQNITIYMYYGNFSAPEGQDEMATFSYTYQKSTAYILDSTPANVQIISFIDGNAITHNETGSSFDKYETTSFGVLSQYGDFMVDGPFHGDPSTAETDSLVPVGWAGTELVYYARAAASNTIFAKAFGSTATVNVYYNGGSCLSNSVTTSGSSFACSIGTAGHVRISSNYPIIVFVEQGTSDPRPIQPTSTGKWIGTGGNNSYVLSNASGADYRYFSSANASETDPADLTGDAGSSIGGGSYGSAPAFLVRSTNNPVGVHQHGDGDGSDAHYYQLLRDMGTVYGANNQADYISVASDQPAYCEVHEASNGVLVGSGTATSSNSSVYFLGFGTGDSNTYTTGAWYMECDVPVAAYYQRASDGSEETLWSPAMNRQYAYPAPSAGSPGTEEVAESPIAYWRFDEGYGTTVHNSLETHSEAGMVGWWKFNEGTGSSLADEMTLNDGAFGGGTTPTWSADGRTGYTLDFNGNQDYVNVTNDSTLEPTNQITFSAWSKIEGEGSHSDGVYVLSKGQQGTAPYQSYTLAYVPSSDKFYCKISESGTSVLAYSTSTFSPTSAWIHIACTYDNSNLRIYVNGVEEGYNEHTGNIQYSLTTSNDLHIGSWNYSTYYRSFEGKIDDVRIYERALSAAEVSAQYNSLTGHYYDVGSPNWSDGAQPNSDQNPIGKAIDFNDDEGEYVAVQDHDHLDFTDGDDFSISLWFKRDETTSEETVLAKRNGDVSTDIGYSIKTLNPDASNRIQLEVSDGTDEFSIRSSTSFDNTNWHHIVFTFDESSSSGCKMYLDGKDDSATTSGTLANVGSIANALQFRFGAESDGGVPFDGRIDEVQLFDYVLTSDDVKIEYNRGFSAALGVGDDGDTGSDPIVHWKFDEGSGYTAVDSSSYEHHAISDTTPTWDYGKYGGAIDTTSYGFYHPDDPDLDNTSAITVEAWVNRSSAADWQRIVGKYFYSGGSLGSYLLYFNNANQVHFTIYNGSTWPTSGVSSTTLTNGEWYHVAGVYDGTNVKIYVNGVLENQSADTSGAIPNTTYCLTVGYTADTDCTTSAQQRLAGKVDDVRVYNYARTTEQIVMDMNAGHPVGGSPVPSQLGYWKFDEGYGDTAYDDSSSGNNGNLGGSGASCPGASACPTWEIDGYYDKALWFDGSDDWVHLDNLNTDIDGSEGTVSAWINLDAMTATSVVFNAYVNTSNDISIYWQDSASELRFRYIAGGTTELMNTSLISDTEDAWHYVAMTWDKDTDDEVVAYVDGKEVNSSQTLGTWAGTILDYVSVGSQGDTDQGFHFKGHIDEVKVYGTALSAAQIKTDYNLGKSIVLGAYGTDSSGNSSRSADRSYCPPGDTTSSCGPILEWKFDEGTGTSAYDTSTSNSTGTLTLMEATDWIYGVYGKALTFDGGNDYVLGSNESTYDFGTGSFTVTGWFKRSAVMETADEVAVAKSWYGTNIPGAPNATGFRVYQDQSTTFTCFGIDDDTTWGPDDSACADNYDDDAWHHFVAVKNGTSEIELYLDGYLAAEDTSITATGSLDNNINVTAGDAYYTGGVVLDTSYWTGEIDHVQIFDYAFNEEQVAWNYNRGKPIAHWKLDESLGTTAYDSGIYELDGTLNNFPTTCWVDGVISGGIDVDGSDDYISTSDHDILSFGDTTQDFPMSIAAWVNMDDATDFVVMNKGHTTFTNSQEWTFRTNSSDQLSLILYDASATYYIDQESNGTLTTSQNSWIHVAATYSGSGAASGITLYVNGQEVASTAGSNSYTAMHNLGSVGGNIGAYIPLSGSKVIADGTIDDVRLYRYELFPEQVRDIYNQGAAVRFPD